MRQVQQYAVWLLARRAYSAHELLTKFRTKFLPDEELFVAVLKKLQTNGIQSDALFVEGFVRSHSDWGSRRLQLELGRRGISSELIAAVLPDADTEEVRCQTALTKRLKGAALPESYKEQQKLIAFLARRGFMLDTIRRALKI